MKVEFINSINEINKEEWNAIVNSDYPFLKYEFLESQEKHNCVSEERGWNPFHVIVSENDKKIAIMPMYVKTDSQVHIAHNVELGKNSLIAAKSGIAGSSKVGKNFRAGGRVGVSDHTNIGKNVTAGVGSMIISDIEDNETVLGYPARKKKITLAIWASLKKIPEQTGKSVKW